MSQSHAWGVEDVDLAVILANETEIPVSGDFGQATCTAYPPPEKVKHSATQSQIVPDVILTCRR
eukprot:5703578-Amphidinium_carterae.1